MLLNNTNFLTTFLCQFHLNHDIKFISLLQKGACPYECMDDWEKLSETSLPNKESFYSNLNMEDNTDEDYVHAKRVCKEIAEVENIMIYMFKAIH